MRTFDRKFGNTFLDGIETAPGIYWFSDDLGKILYVGKAKNLRTRLSQYRNANRTKKDRKKHTIIRESCRLDTITCDSETAALLMENEWIRRHRPPFNVAGAYEFLYPSIALRQENTSTYIVCTSLPERWRELGFRLYGSFGSRIETRENFATLIELLGYIGHPEPIPGSTWRDIPYSQTAGFRQLDADLVRSLETFLAGDSPEFLEELVLRLVEKPRARNSPREIRKLLLQLRRFFRDEPAKLKSAREFSGHSSVFVPQRDRDRLLIILSQRREETLAES